MRHYVTRTLFDHWSSLGQSKRLPARSEIDPLQIKDALPNTFILERIDPDHLVFRLAGTALCENYGREFRDQNFLQLWEGNQRRSIRMLIDQMITLRRGGHIHYSAYTLDKAQFKCEILLLPLLDQYQQPTRIIGTACSLEPIRELGNRKLVKHKVSDIELLDGNAVASSPVAAKSVLSGAHPSYLRLVHSRG